MLITKKINRISASEALVDWIYENQKHAEKQPVDVFTDLHEGAVLDSFKMMLLIDLIEQFSGQEIDLRDISAEKTRTVNEILNHYFDFR